MDNTKFHKIGTYPSPDETTKSTVYNCNLHNGLYRVISMYGNDDKTHLAFNFEFIQWSDILSVAPFVY